MTMRRLAAHWLPVKAAGVSHFEILILIAGTKRYRSKVVKS